MPNAVAGLFDERAAAERAVKDLLANGFTAENISIVVADPNRAGSVVVTDGNMAPEGMATGAGAGALVGGLFGLLVGVTAVAVPGGILAAGPLAAMLVGGIAGAATGGVVGGLVGLGIPKTYADVYAEGVRRGGVLVTVACSQEACGRAEDVLRSCGAADIERRADYYRSTGWNAYDASAPAYTPEEAVAERARIEAATNTTAASPKLDLATMEPYFRSDYLSRYGEDSGSYESFAPAYRWGYLQSTTTSYDGMSWAEAEDQLLREWERANPSTWDRYRGAIAYAWERARVPTVTGAELI